jgi:GR25 family glycosyltransferase involved in LPS biosynthesis
MPRPCTCDRDGCRLCHLYHTDPRYKRLWEDASFAPTATYPQRWFLINLDRRPDRLKEATEQLTRAGIEFERFAAIDGHALPLPKNETKGAGAFGCRLSHVRVLEQAISRGLKCVGVFEDDAVLADDFQLRLNAALERVPEDWELLYLGTQHRQTPTPVNDSIVRCTDCHRTHSYIVRGECIGKLYQIWSSNTGHVDHILNNTGAFRELKAYAIDPPITGQGNSKSDINGRVNQERWWHQDKKGRQPDKPYQFATDPSIGDKFGAVKKPCNCGKKQAMPRKPL